MKVSVMLLWFAVVVGIPESLFAGEPVYQLIAGQKQLDLQTHRGNAHQAYTKALEEGKFTIILFDSEYCGFCKNMITLLGSEVLAKYADRVVVSVTDGDIDKGARQLEEALGVVRYPTLVVLKTNNKNVHVAGRIEGEVPLSEIDRIIFEATKEQISN